MSASRNQDNVHKWQRWLTSRDKGSRHCSSRKRKYLQGDANMFSRSQLREHNYKVWELIPPCVNMMHPSIWQGYPWLCRLHAYMYPSYWHTLSTEISALKLSLRCTLNLKVTRAEACKSREPSETFAPSINFATLSFFFSSLAGHLVCVTLFTATLYSSELTYSAGIRPISHAHVM
jgi:hypothetical protein